MGREGKRGRFARIATSALLWLAAAIFLCGFLSGEAWADGISGFVEYIFARAETESSDATGFESRSDIDTFLQRYNLVLDKRVYPNLRLLSGGLFERSEASGSTDTETSSQDIDSSLTKMRPFVDLRLSTPLYQAGAVYSRGEDRQKTQGASTLTLIRDQYVGTLGWNPDGFPSLKFQYFRQDTHDRGRDLQDVTNQSYQLTSSYRPVGGVFLYYQGILAESQNRLNNSETSSLFHSGRISYAGQWWNRRITLGTDYNVSFRESEIRAGGGGEVSVPLFPLSGFSAIDDTPEQGALSANPALVDGDLQAGSGINLGFQAGDTQRRNIGLDFGVQTEVNTLIVWIDRQLPSSVADSFSWDIYSSPDNLNWSLRETVSPAPLDPFVPRFDIRFQNVTDRFIKAVLRPLAPAVPFAADFPLIQVTEVQAALRSPAASARGRTVSSSHIYNFTLRTRILDVPTLAHELSYSLTAARGAHTRWTLSNGLFAAHRFSKSVSGTARFAREDARDAQQTRTGYLLTGSLEAVPLPTLRHNFLVSGRTDRTDGEDSRTLSVFLYNSAELYPGVDLNVALGRSRNVAENGQTTDSTQADASATVVPNRRLTLNLVYSDKRDVTSGGGTPGERTLTTRTMEGSVALYPVDTVYLYGSYRIEEFSGQDSRFIRNYSASWTPFRDGKLHLSFLYSETFRSEANDRDRTISPNLRLDLGRGSFFTLAYQDTSIRSDLRTSDSNSVSGNLRITF